MNNNLDSEDTSLQDAPNLNDFFEDNINDIKISWRKNGGYKIYYNLKRCFCSPLKSVRPKEDLNLISQVGILLQTDQSSNKETIDKCAQFIALHRHMENTSARKRLERWAKYVISIYLITVLFIILLEGGLFNGIGLGLNIGSQVTIVLLSTTTVNIIGLGLIVLRGHFYQKEFDQKEQGKSDNKEE